MGQMSAWYVLPSCGIYPVCPGETRFEITSPTFDRIDIIGGKEKKFSIIAVNDGPGNVFIQAARLNGKDYRKCYLDYQQILQGGTLELRMADKPNKNWGIEE